MGIADQPTPPRSSRTDDEAGRIKEKARVLVVDDSDFNSALTRRLLEEAGCEVDVLAEGGGVAIQLLTVEYDLVCLDVKLPDIDGFSVCRIIRQSPLFGHVPVLMVSAHFTDEQNVVKGLESGANDYVRVPFAPMEFLGRVNNLIRLKKTEDRLRAMALEDPLTHLGNRAMFFERAEQEFSRALRHDRPLCLALVDIDNFKSINDTYGHVPGDEVLRGVATLIHENIRREDLAARWGGDEFAILFVESRLDGARHVAERILTSILATDFSFKSLGITAAASMGLGELDPGIHNYVDAFVACVDKALYEAKKAGGGRIVIAR